MALHFRNSALGASNRPVWCISVPHARRTCRPCCAATSGASGSAGEGAAEARAWIAAWRAKQAVTATSTAAEIPTSQTPEAPAPQKSVVAHYAQMVVALGALYGIDLAIKKAFTEAAITFPAPLAGMFIVVASLLVIGEKSAAAVLDFYTPALDWVAKWLPLFYVASLVTLPNAMKGMAGIELLKVLAILTFGMAATLLFTAQTTVAIRALVKTPNKEVAKSKPSSPFRAWHFAVWGGIAATSFALCAMNPAVYGPQTHLAFNLAATVGGYMLGNLVPKSLHAVLHPVVVCAVLSNAGAAAHAALRGLPYDVAQKVYYSKDVANMGAGDLLMSFLGLVIISFGFRVYQQRDTMKRHAPEILGATLLSSIFSLFSSAFAARALDLPSNLARAMIPRSVTVALALPIGAQLDAPLALVAAGVLLQGLLGANFGPGLMSAVGIKDTIARGLAAAGTAGGLGTASLTSKEPEALPFCALSYALVGILSTLLVSCPPVRSALLSIVG